MHPCSTPARAGQSGSAIWNADGHIVAIHIAGDDTGRGWHRAMASWVFDWVDEVVGANGGRE
jgi:V8-like Glu-specific endopeptidase